jgi:hypothetical protein
VAQADAGGRCVGFEIESAWSYGARSHRFPRSGAECVGMAGRWMPADSLQPLCSRSRPGRLSYARVEVALLRAWLRLYGFGNRRRAAAR